MTNLTCFWHPKLGYFDLSLDHMCEQCTRSMGYPLEHLPVTGPRDFQVLEAIDRKH